MNISARVAGHLNTADQKPNADARVCKLTSPPQFPDPERRAVAIHLVLWISIFTLTAITILLPFSSMDPSTRLRFLILQSASYLPLFGAPLSDPRLQIVAYFFLILVYGETVYSHIIVFQTIHERDHRLFCADPACLPLLFGRKTMLGFVTLGRRFSSTGTWSRSACSNLPGRTLNSRRSGAMSCRHRTQHLAHAGDLADVEKALKTRIAAAALTVTNSELKANQLLLQQARN